MAVVSVLMNEAKKLTLHKSFKSGAGKKFTDLQEEINCTGVFPESPSILILRTLPQKIVSVLSVLLESVRDSERG